METEKLHLTSVSPPPSVALCLSSTEESNIYFEPMRKRGKNLAENILHKHFYSAGERGMPFSTLPAIRCRYADKSSVAALLKPCAGL